MAFGNRLVARLLQSPLHRIMSGGVALVRTRGRRTGRVVQTPVQYAELADGIAIVPAHHEAKTWWRNFIGGGDLELLIRGRWRPLRARAIRGADEPELVGPILAGYCARFPRATRALTGTDDETRTRTSVVVWCTDR